VRARDRGLGVRRCPLSQQSRVFGGLRGDALSIPYSLPASRPRSGAIFDLSTMPRLKPCLMPSATMHSRLFSCPDGPDTERRTVPSRAIRWAMRGHMEAGQSLASHAPMLSDAAGSFTSAMLVKSPAEGRAQRLCDGPMRGRVCSGICPSVSLLPRLSSARSLPLRVRVEVCSRSDGIGPPAVLCQFRLARARRAMADEEQQQKSHDSERTANDKFWRPDLLHQWDTELIEKALQRRKPKGRSLSAGTAPALPCVHRPISTSSILLERQQFKARPFAGRSSRDLANSPGIKRNDSRWLEEFF
jgi:hypothetical protein